MKVVIGQAYHLRLDSKLWREMRPYPPLGALYAASAVRSMGHEVIFYDAMLSTDAQKWPCLLRDAGAELAVLYEDNFNYLTKMCLLNMRDAAFDMISAAKRENMTVVVCSSDASDHPDVYHAAGADYVIRGEGEATLQDIIQGIQDKSAGLIAVAGAASTVDGKWRFGPARGLIRDLDTLPPPAWDLVDLARYRKVWRSKHGRYSINLVTSRGCPYHCNWCAKPIWGQTWHTRSPAAVADEIAWLDELIGVDHIWFTDDIFGLKRHWVHHFGTELRQRQLVIRYKCLSRADLLLREGEIQALARSGCETVWIGAESGSQTVLDGMEKGTTIDQILTACQTLHDAGIGVGFFIQFGYPGEGWREIAATFHLVRMALPDELGISVAYPLPGTGFMEQVKRQLLTGVANWQDSDDLAMLYEGPFPTRFYRLLHRQLHDYLALLHTINRATAGGIKALARNALKAGLLTGRLALRGAALGIVQFTGHSRHLDIHPQLPRAQAAAPSAQDS